MPSGFDVGSLVWIDGDGGFPVPGHVVAVSGTNLKVQNEDSGKVSSVPAKLAIQRINNGRHGVDDMIKLDDLNEGSILYNLAIRYEAQLIYTYVGKILVAVNPYALHDIYTNEVVKQYTGSPIGSLPPHIFAIGSAAYTENQKTGSNQVIVISGESGAGKTESTKLLVQYLASVNKNGNSRISEQIVEATPLLESFGNAKTVKNDNSSRFGKYLEIYFGSSGCICGGRISEYLLERSRIVGQSSEERNYHIFYEMLAGLPQETKNRLSLKNADEYFYLNQGRNSVIPNRNDKASFSHLMTAMDVLDITRAERDGIFNILGAILHLGNAAFYKGLASSHDVAVLRDEEEARIASRLLGLDEDDVITALTHKQTETRGEQISSPRNTEQAVDARDAIAKELYSRVFTWLVNKINGIVFHGKQGPSIAILDIFGFEDFKVNSFEQLCINYANESLHFFFNQFIFRLEQDEYKLEGIHWREVQYYDNQACLDLLARPPHGILHLLTDESNFPKATDASFLEKCHHHHKSSKAYLKPKMQVPEFGINHFAGPVSYQVRGFLDKNRDGLKQDLTVLLCNCRSEFIKDLIPDLMGDKDMQIGGLKLPRNSRVNSLKAPSNSIPKNTVCAKFNDSLIRLVVAMKKCNPFFIRCIRPNPDKAPSTFINKTVIEQLRYCGVLETVKIRKNGYPVRIVFQDFIKRYRCLSNQLVLFGATPQQNCGIILNFMQISKDRYQFGHSKLFLREDVEYELEESRIAKRIRMAVVLQARVRGYAVSQKYLKMKKATIVLQSQTRRYLARKKYLKARKGFIMLQALYRLKRRKKTMLQHLRLNKSNTNNEQQTVDAEEQTTEESRATMEEEEWDKQALVDVTQLEIPAELAMVLTHLNGWQVPYETTLGPVKSDVVPFVCAMDELPTDIDEYLFSKYAQENFQDQKFRVSRGPINSSLLKLKYSDSIEAVDVFKLIMRFMEDRTLTGARQLVLGNYIVQKGISNPDIRDEILCQLCNQTWGNPVERYCDKACLLLALCLDCFKPSDKLHNYLLKFCSDQAYDGYKAFCQHKLLCWKGRKGSIPRALPPSVLEWEAAKRKSSIAVKCEMVDGEKRMIEVESCTTGQQLAATILKDRGVSDRRGWTVDVYDSDCHFSLAGHDYVMDVVTEQEYPPSFPAGISPSLITLRPANKLTGHRKRTLSDLHRPHSKRAKVAEIAHRFSFSDRPTGTPTVPTVPTGPREDALSAATSARITAAAYSHAPSEDRLVAQTAMRTRNDNVDGPVNGHVPAAPPLPTAGFAAPPPPPPPPPPIVPPAERIVVVRRYADSKDKKKKKPDNGPQLSMAEVVAKAKRMSEARSRAMSSISNDSGKTNEVNGGDAFENAVVLRKVKSSHKNLPQKKEEEPDSELKRAMQAKANRVSRLWQENENNMDNILRKKQTEESRTPPEYHRKSWVHSEARSSSSSSQVSNDETVTTVDVENENDSNSSASSSKKNSIQRNGSLHRTDQDVNDFVDSLFDPVLSHNFDDLMDEKSVSKAIKGGGGMNRSTAPQTSTTTAGSSATSPVSMTSPIGMNGTVYVPITPVPNGYPDSRYMAMNGYPGGTPNMASPAFMPIMPNGPMMTGYTSPTPDVASLAAQQQILLEHLLSQQRLIQEQQKQLSQKSNDQLISMTQQHEEQLKSLQEQLNAARANVPNGTDHISSGSLMNGNVDNVPLSASTPRREVFSRIQSFESPPPPPGFSDNEEHSPPQKTIPPPPPTQPPLPPPPPPPLEEPTVPYPPPPLSPPPLPPTNNRLITSSSGVASAVAALEGKSTSSPTTLSTPTVATIKSIEVIQNTSSYSQDRVVNSIEPERPQLKSRLSSSLSALVLQEKKTTKKYNNQNRPYICAGRTTWKMSIRKELFSPNEKLDNRIEQRLVFLQIVRDTYSDACCRMTSSDRQRMKALLQKYGITPERPHSSSPVEDIVIQTARELPLYFSRFYLATGQNDLPDVHYIAVGEQGVHLIKREKISDELQIANKILYDNVEKVRVNKNKLIISFKESKISVVTDRAEEIKLMVDPYLRQIELEAKYVRAMYDYVTQEDNMLNFKKGDVIQVIDKPDLEEGWFFGIFAGRSGYFPAEYVTHIKEDPAVAPKSSLIRTGSVGNLNSKEEPSPNISRKRSGSTRSTKSDKSEYGGETYSMMEFAMHNFRHGQEVVHRKADGTVRGTLRIKGTSKQSNKGSHKNIEWTWKGLAELVKYSKTSIQASLLRLDGHQNKLAIDCFHAIMKFMGDLAMGRGQKDTDLVYFLIKTCRENAVLCDEVYCQLIKQVTSNKSTNVESCSRGWRLLIILTSYVKCGDVLKPYLVKFLQSTACDPKREFHGAAAICEQNLMKTFKYGGRRSHPTAVELKQLVQGRQTKRQVMLLPGMISKMMKIQTCSTGYDVIKEMCNEMDLATENDYIEYGLFSSVAKQTVMTPIQTTDYVMDTIGQMEKQDVEFNLWFRRVLWYQPSRFDNELFVSVIYHQILPDYFSGYLTGVKQERSLTDPQLQNEVAELGALQLLSNGIRHTTPVQSDIDKVIPKYVAERLRSSQWLILVQDHFRGFTLTPAQARKRFLEIVSKWPNFGSTYFAVKYCSHPNVTGECIAAVDKKGIHFLDITTKQNLKTEPFIRIISTRILVSDKKRFFLDLKIGDSMVQKVTRMETQEAKELAALIYKYVNQATAEMNLANEGLAGVLRSQDLKL